MAEEITPEEKDRIKQMVDDLVERAKIASKEYMKLDQETINQIIKKMSMAGLENHMKLAKMAVEETGRGIYEDKITKNMFATEYIYHSIKYDKTVGVIDENEEEGIFVNNQPAEQNQPVIENMAEPQSLAPTEPNPVPVPENQNPFIKPIEGVVTSGFGARESVYQNVTGNHTGVDIGANSGTQILASMSGVVTQVSREGDYGNHIRITKDNVTTLYAHCQDILVAEGQEIMQGQVIATVGSTGNSTGPHLHFEIRIDDVPINPAEKINF